MRNEERLMLALGGIGDEWIEDAGRFLHLDRARRSVRARRVPLLIAAALAALALAACGLYYLRWSRGLEQRFQPSGEQMAQAEECGLAAQPTAAVTANGITVSVAQTLADENTAYIALRIRGFALPEGQFPSVGGMEVTVDGKRPSAVTGGFTEFGREDGTPCFVDREGALEFTLSISDAEGMGGFAGRELSVALTDLGVGDKAMHSTTVPGRWELRWTMSAAEDVRKAAPEVEIGNTGIVLKEVEITPLSLRLVLQLQEDWPGFDTLEPFPLRPTGLRLRDASVLTGLYLPGGERWLDRDAHLLELQLPSLRLVDPAQVEALLFTWTQEPEAELIEAAIP